MSQQAALLRAGSEPGDTSHPETASKSPTTSVGAAHGIGSNPIAGPLKAQAQPLQTTQLENMNKENGSEKPGPPAESPRARDPRVSQNRERGHALSPSQQAFVDQLKVKYQTEPSKRLEATPQRRPHRAPSSPRSQIGTKNRPESAEEERPTIHGPAANAELQEYKRMLAATERQLAEVTDKIALRRAREAPGRSGSNSLLRGP